MFRFLKSCQDAIVRTIAVIGEAAAKIQKDAPEFVAAHPDLPWKQMRDIRNKVIHDYFNVVWDIVWDTIKDDLPSVLKNIRSLLQLTPYPRARDSPGPIRAFDERASDSEKQFLRFASQVISRSN